MPIYEYVAAKAKRGCPYCADGFDLMQPADERPLKKCPRCGAPVRKVIAAPRVGGSKSKLDDRAKSAGFHKLKKLGDGNYEKKY